MEVERTRLRPYGLRDLNKIPELQALSDEQRFDMRVVGSVLPFRTNQYVVEELIDWSNIPNDPLFQLTFMQREMLEKDDFDGMADLIRKDASDVDIQIKANEIRMGLNPHPAGQMEKNVPQFNDHPVPGLQHKYRETALVFPTQGQTCFAYCTFCFRWPQFVDMDDVNTCGNVSWPLN